MYNMKNTTKLVALATIIAMAFLINIAQVNAFESFIPYSKMNATENKQATIGFHSNDRYIWYKNNNQTGFDLDAVLSDEQQKVWDESDDNPTGLLNKTEAMQFAATIYFMELYQRNMAMQ